ncbi:glycosyltransferase family 4 protein [Rubellimicrobium arenae]|uniref:glycosyltransferase family 4 protein n=1 Tax=Rubellimicrobium arenae TaxID=2817372 RepID=UPI001B3118AA
MALPGPVAWLTGEYIRVSHTFMRREVAALRDLGFDLRTFSIRRSGRDQIVGRDLEEEAERTFYVLEVAKRPLAALRAHASALGRSPRLWLRTLSEAWSTAPKGVQGRLYNLIYFHEAVVLAGELRKQGIVHLHNHLAMSSSTVARLAAPLAGISWSFTLHGPDEIAEADHWRLDDKIAQADFVACISAFARSQAMLHAPQADWAKLHVVHCGVEPDRYARRAEQTTDRLLFVGRLAAVKGVPVLLAALARARATRPSLRLTLVGDGPDRKKLEREAEALGLGEAVTFRGYCNQDEVARILSESSALVLPSFAEGVPVVLMEALATGLPVIATRIAGIGELVEDGVSGLLVPPGEEEALARAILGITEHPARAAAMGAAGQARVREEYDSRAEAARLASLVRWAVVGGPRPSRRPEEFQP